MSYSVLSSMNTLSMHLHKEVMVTDIEARTSFQTFKCMSVKNASIYNRLFRLGLVDNHLKLYSYINIFVPGALSWAEKLGMQAVDE